MINVFKGWRTWKAIWCGENLILLPVVTFSSTVKNVPELLYPNRSGVPKLLVFSILVQLISGVIFLICCQNLDSFLAIFCRN